MRYEGPNYKEAWEFFLRILEYILDPLGVCRDAGQKDFDHKQSKERETKGEK